MKYIYEKTKKLIDTQLKQVNLYLKNDIYHKKIYLWTNECVDAYLKHMDIKECDDVLTVLGSGDQLFSLISKGVKNVDTFDINDLSEYYVFGLKKALIERYNYSDFFKNWERLNENISLDELTTLLSDTTVYMDKKYHDFWKKIIDYNYKIQKDQIYHQNILHLISHGNDYNQLDSYTKCEEDFNKLKNNLNQSNINFKKANIINIKKHYKKNYDVIILSNILDYIESNWGKNWGMDQLDNFIDMLFSISNENARIMLFYMFYYSEHKCNGIKKLNIEYEKFENNNNIYGFDNELFHEDKAIILKK